MSVANSEDVSANFCISKILETAGERRSVLASASSKDLAAEDLANMSTGNDFSQLDHSG